MPMKLYFRSLLIMTTLWGLVFALAMALAYVISMSVTGLIPLGMEYLLVVIPVIFALLVVFFQYLISPWIMDVTLNWVYDVTKYPVELLPPHLRDFLNIQMQKHHFSLKWVGIIHDNNPNAFTYGHTKKRARIVITEGITTYLTPEEQVAVVAHECGHIVNRDFIWMTLAAAVPLVLYSFYQGLWTFARVSGKGSKNNKNNVGVIAMALAVIAWIVYYLSHFLVLFLSRVREYYADAFSAYATDDPGALSHALVKIAYGMVRADAEQKTRMENDQYSAEDKQRMSRQYAFNQGGRALGIFDVSSAKSLAMGAYGRGAQLDEQSVAAAAAWDLNNPWGRFIELQSTHPLPAKRIMALNKLQEKEGEPVAFPDMGSIKYPESLWDEFFIDLFLLYVAPSMIFILPILGSLLTLFFAPQYILAGMGVGLFLAGAVWKWRRREKYPKLRVSDKPTTVVHCLTDITKNGYYEVSPLRSKGAVMIGKVVGRGTPGYYFSEDVVIQDKTGIIRTDYSSLIPFMNWFFAIFRVRQLAGQQIKVIGWYQRVPMPVLRVWKIFSADDRVFTNHWSGANWLFNWLLWLASIAMIVVGISG